MFSLTAQVIQMKTFESFLYSQYFSDWCSSRRPGTAKYLSRRPGYDFKCFVKGDYLTLPDVQSTNPQSMAFSALCYMDNEMNNMLYHEKPWISVLTSAMELQPLPFSMVSMSEEGFPLTYVNPAFEKMTGYSSSEIVGRNCKFLQYDHSAGSFFYHEKSREILNLRASLKLMLTSCHVLRNFRKDGTPFWNCLLMKPLYNQFGAPVCFIGLQFEVSSNELANMHDRSMFCTNKYLLNILPSVLYEK
jgi:PAS domain S-box-containing protein